MNSLGELGWEWLATIATRRLAARAMARTPPAAKAQRPPPPRGSLRRVILESPYAGEVDANVAFARRCVRDSLERGEAPLASHLLYTQPGILDDTIPIERLRGIGAGLAWYRLAEACVVYLDRGLSDGMRCGIAAASAADVTDRDALVGPAGLRGARTATSI